MMLSKKQAAARSVRVAKKKAKAKVTPLPYWPGLTRLYDKRVDCGAVMLLGSHARALVEAVEIARMVLLDTKTEPGDVRLLGAMASASNILRFNFGIKESEDEGSK
jgi:hypothetical protein